MAMLKLCNDPDWKRIGGKLLVPVHDELIVEVPYEFKDEGAEILSRCMCEAGNFMPFPLKCDVETTFRWYGLGVESIECWDKPTSLDVSTLSESNIKWIQSRLIENEFLLPVHKNPDGSKPIGDAAQGLDGIWSDELNTFIDEYMKRYGLSDDLSFIEHIDAKVLRGVIN